MFKKPLIPSLIFLALFCPAVTFSGCEKGSMEEVGEEIDDEIDDATDDR